MISKTIYRAERKGTKNTSAMLSNDVRTARQQRRYEAKINRLIRIILNFAQCPRNL